MKNKTRRIGVMAVASPLPLFIVTIFWSWIWFFCSRF